MNISNIITHNALIKPNDRAIISADTDDEITWLDLERSISKFGNCLVNMGVKRGDVIALYLPNSPEFVIGYFAVTRIGAIVLPINICLKSGEISYILSNSQARILVGASEEVEKYITSATEHMFQLDQIVTIGRSVEGCVSFDLIMSKASELLEPVNCSDEDVAALVYTSGTSGKPKGVMLTHCNLFSLGDVNAKALHINDQDVVYSAAPLCHIVFVVSVIGPFIAGTGILTLRRFNPLKCFEVISRYKVTHITGVPTMYIRMLRIYDKTNHDLGSWRLAFSAGGPMPAEYIPEVEDEFGVFFVKNMVQPKILLL